MGGQVSSPVCARTHRASVPAPLPHPPSRAPVMLTTLMRSRACPHTRSPAPSQLCTRPPCTIILCERVSVCARVRARACLRAGLAMAGQCGRGGPPTPRPRFASSALCFPPAPPASLVVWSPVQVPPIFSLYFGPSVPRSLCSSVSSSFPYTYLGRVVGGQGTVSVSTERRILQGGQRSSDIRA